MYSLDVKLTVWERVKFETEEEMQDVLAKLKSGELESSTDVCDYLDRSANYIDDTSLVMSLEENNGNPTMEILNEDGNTIWNNVEGDIMIDEEASRFICGVCGNHVDSYIYNEKKDIDECEDCQEQIN